MTWIGFRDLAVECIIGVLDHERQTPQALYVDLELRYHPASAPAQDDLALSVDYSRVATQVTELLQAGRFGLLESAAQAIGTQVAQTYPAIDELRLELRKPHALPAADHSFVRYQWTR